MIIWRNSKPPPNNATNYLWEEFPKRWTYVINYDKIENKRRAKNLPRQTFALDVEIEGVTDGKLLNKIINQSLLHYPRKYLLMGAFKQNTHMGAQMYSFTVSKIFKKNVSQNLIRKAFINYFYDKSSISIKKEIAKRMRHSVEVAEQSYRKINIPVDDIPADDIPLDDIPNDTAEPTKEYILKYPSGAEGSKCIQFTISIQIKDLKELL